MWLEGYYVCICILHTGGDMKKYLIIFVVLLVGSGIFSVFCPRTIEIRTGPSKQNFTRMRYYGLSTRESFDLWGRIPISFEVPLYQIYPDLIEPDKGNILFTLDHRDRGKEKCRGTFISRFPDGKIRMEGDGIFHCTYKMPSIGLLQIKNAVYYKPDGSIGSKITQGTGIETFWSDTGECLLRQETGPS